jgi:DNA-binding transcriptional MerR regulator
VQSAKATGQTSRQEIPDKLYFRIGDVSRLAGVKAYVLRYWESEFPSISPKKSGTGHRLYRRKDVELILEIKHLLYEKRFTIEGARKAIDTRGKPTAVKSSPIKASQAALFAPAGGQDLRPIRLELEKILEILR